jgi:hypothetical protein
LQGVEPLPGVKPVILLKVCSFIALLGSGWMDGHLKASRLKAFKLIPQKVLLDKKVDNFNQVISHHLCDYVNQ